MSFPGFPAEINAFIRIPEQFFRQVLYEIDDLDELKLTLYTFWRLEHMEGTFKYLLMTDYLADEALTASMGVDPQAAPLLIAGGLHKASQRGTLLMADITHDDRQDQLICLNSPRGRALIEAARSGEWKPPERGPGQADVPAEHPNIFQLYESNIGPLTPMIADALRDAETTYQAIWIEDAFRIAVERNRRNWKYIEAILKRWQEGGRDDRKDKQDRRDTEEARRRYGEWEN